MFIPSSSWDEPPTHRPRKEEDGFLWKAPISLAGSAKEGERKRRRRSVDSLTFEPSTLPVLNIASLPAPLPGPECVPVKKFSGRVPPTAMHAHVPSVSSNWIQPRPDAVPVETLVSVVPTEPPSHVPSPVAKKPRRVSRPLKANPKPDASIGASSSNVVFQDLKMKGGTKSSRGAEALRRRISRQKNDRWREANGVRRRGKKAATWRREQLGKEMRHERNLVDALTEESIAEIFSPGVDPEFIQSLLNPVEIPDSTCFESAVDEKTVVDRVSMELFLKTEFNHSEFRPGQFEAIEAVLGKSRSLIVLPTGAGKSLCYQFPSVFLRKFFPKKKRLTIVVSPLIALMTDQLKLLPLCARGAVLHSNMSPTQSHLVYTAIAKEQIDILFVAPERLLMYSMREILARVFLVAIDEAHCLSEWSHTFRPAYLRLGKLVDEEIKPDALLALTATATMQTVESVCGVLSIGNVIRTDRTDSISNGCVQRKNLSLFARRSANPVMDFIEFLSQPANSKLGPIIVYVQYKWQTENVSQVLRERGFGSAEAYHGGLSASERSEIHQKFMENKIRFMVATIAFGMGIDKRNVRAVVHLTVPKSVEAYVQESGRAGRDGEPAFCRCYFNGEDFARVRNRCVSDAIRIHAVETVANLIAPSNDGLGPLFLPESIQGTVSQSQMSLVLSLLEKEIPQMTVFHGFPKILKLRFFSATIEQLAEIDPIMANVWEAPAKDGVDKAVEHCGVVTIDTLKAIRNSGLTPPQFMHKLALAARAQKFAIAKSDWGHFVLNGGAIDRSTVLHVFNVAISSHLLEVNRLDASFALMSRIASESITDDPLVGHSLIQQYFEAEQRLADGDDLVPSILLGAKPGLAASVLREIDQIRNST